MTLKEKIKSYSFWVSLASAVVLILKVIGSKFGFTIDATLASDIITSVCSVLVITGIIVTPTSKANADLEILNSKTNQNSIKENLSILSSNLKETADEILNENTQTTKNKTEELAQDKVELKTVIEPQSDHTSKAQPLSDFEQIESEPQTQQNESCEVLEKPLPKANELKSMLASQKDIWVKDIDTYYQVLLEEIKSLKPNE